MGVTEYEGLYRHTWCDPEIRWILSTVPTATIFDDHDIRDDWNTSAAWRKRATRSRGGGTGSGRVSRRRSTSILATSAPPNCTTTRIARTCSRQRETFGRIWPTAPTPK